MLIIPMHPVQQYLRVDMMKRKKMEDNHSPYSPDYKSCFHFKIDYYEFALISFVTYEL